MDETDTNLFSREGKMEVYCRLKFPCELTRVEFTRPTVVVCLSMRNYVCMYVCISKEMKRKQKATTFSFQLMTTIHSAVSIWKLKPKTGGYSLLNRMFLL